MEIGDLVKYGDIYQWDTPQLKNCIGIVLTVHKNFYKDRGVVGNVNVRSFLGDDKIAVLIGGKLKKEMPSKIFKKI